MFINDSRKGFYREISDFEDAFFQIKKLVNNRRQIHTFGTKKESECFSFYLNNQGTWYLTTVFLPEAEQRKLIDLLETDFGILVEC